MLPKKVPKTIKARKVDKTKGASRSTPLTASEEQVKELFGIQGVYRFRGLAAQFPSASASAVLTAFKDAKGKTVTAKKLLVTGQAADADAQNENVAGVGIAAKEQRGIKRKAGVDAAAVAPKKGAGRPKKRAGAETEDAAAVAPKKGTGRQKKTADADTEGRVRPKKTVIAEKGARLAVDEADEKEIKELFGLHGVYKFRDLTARFPSASASSVLAAFKDSKGKLVAAKNKLLGTGNVAVTKTRKRPLQESGESHDDEGDRGGRRKMSDLSAEQKEATELFGKPGLDRFDALVARFPSASAAEVLGSLKSSKGKAIAAKKELLAHGHAAHALAGVNEDVEGPKIEYDVMAKARALCLNSKLYKLASDRRIREASVPATTVLQKLEDAEGDVVKAKAELLRMVALGA